ncbi:MAG: BON domain-containing protein [Tannerellaceae bacterium]|nr:BON domain-containing protein [Tannerellaceae bacterium]
MKRSVFIYLFGLLAFVTFYACKPSDANLQKDVQSVLVAYPGVNATVNNSVVTLTGTVASEDIKIGAERAARAVKNVKSVTNNIMVNAPAPINQSSVVVSSDDVLTQNIRTALDNAGYKNIDIDVNDGEVTLTGNVQRNNLQEVMQIANDASPKRVINQLEIE